MQDRKLIVNEPEAETVRYIFRLYRQLRSVRELRERLVVEGVRSKRRVLRDGRVRGGKPINRGALYYLLRNRIYRGQIVHKDRAYPGEHEAIIDRELWDAVQVTLTDNTRGTRRRGSRRPSLLTGLLVDECGEGLTPTHDESWSRSASTRLSQRSCEWLAQAAPTNNGFAVYLAPPGIIGLNKPMRPN